jgi:predicted Zn finger-like uncharacterized protein
MSETIACPDCQSKLNLPDEVLGQEVRCPTCRHVFTAMRPRPGAAREENDESGERAPRARPVEVPPILRRDLEEEPPWERAEPFGPEAMESWRSVQTGLYLHMIANFLYAAGTGLLLVFLFLRLAEDRRSGPGGEIVLAAVIVTVGVGLFANWVVALVACCYWQAAPWRLGTRALALACLVLVGLALLRIPYAIVSLSMPHSFARESEFVVPTLLDSLVIEVCRLTLLALFVRSVARHCVRPTLAANALLLALATPILLFGLLLLGVVVALSGGGPGSSSVAGGVGFLGLLLYLALLVWSGMMLNTARVED